MKPADESDFQRFAATATPALLALAGAMTGGQRTAEELVTAVLAQVARRWRRLGPDPTDHATGLLYRRYTGRRWREASHGLLSLDHPEQVATRLRHVVFGQLEPRSRALLALRYQQERSDPELAEIIGSTPEAVGAELDQALARLRELRVAIGGQALADPETDLVDEVRETLRERAGATDQGADLTPAALVQARRQVRTRLGAGALATLLVLGLATGLGVAVLRPEPPPPDLTGQAVVTSYAERGSWYVLDPATGDYRLAPAVNVQVSPDLRWHLSTSPNLGTQVRVTSTTDPDDSIELDTGVAVIGLAWSPDSTRVAGTVMDFPDPSGAEPVFPEPSGQVALFEIAEGQVRVLDLPLPPDRVVRCCGVVWLDTDRFAVQTAARDRLVPATPWGFPVPAEATVTDELHAFDLTGAPATELPIDTGALDTSDQPHSGLAWSVAGVLGDGRLLVSRTPEPGALELATVDPESNPGRYRPVTLTLPELPEPEFWRPVIDGWAGTAVLVTASRWPDPAAEVAPDELPHQTYIVDLDTGRTAPLDPGAELSLPPDLTDVTGVSLGDATQLAPAAAHRAFLPPRPAG